MKLKEKGYRKIYSYLYNSNPLASLRNYIAPNRTNGNYTLPLGEILVKFRILENINKMTK